MASDKTNSDHCSLSWAVHKEPARLLYTGSMWKQ